MNKSKEEKIKAEIEALKKEYRDRDRQIMELSNKKAKLASKLLYELENSINAAAINEEDRKNILFMVEGLSMLFKQEEVESFKRLLEYESKAV